MGVKERVEAVFARLGTTQQAIADSLGISVRTLQRWLDAPSRLSLVKLEKMKRPHIVPLSRQTLGLLGELQAVSGKGRFLFPSARTTSRPISNNTMNAALRRLGVAQGEHTAHGFRSTASTILHERGWPHNVIERQLAHAEKNQVVAAYNHAEWLDQRREMMQWWADWLEEQEGKTI